MHCLKFDKKLVPLVKSGLKTKTWRLGNDKAIGIGDCILLQEAGGVEPFGRATVTSVKETTFRELTDADCQGHEHFCSQREMLTTYSGYYGSRVTAGTALTVIGFRLTDGGEDSTREWLGHIAADLRNKLSPLCSYIEHGTGASEADREQAKESLGKLLAIIERDISLLPAGSQ